MIINSYNCEFGYELIAVLPYAYWLNQRHELRRTISGVDSECLYYFSPSHKINPRRRSWYFDNTNFVKELYKDNIPNIWIHKKELDTSKWTAPPYKEVYKSEWAKLEKPHLIVYNRYNKEWPANPFINCPVNYFSLVFLKDFFSRFTDKYSIIYVNVEGHSELYDHSDPLHLEDKKLCKYYGIIHIDDLLERHPGLSYNQVQMYYFANTEKFLTMNGGGGILASYFGGTNIIYTKHCKELETGDFNYYPLLGGSEIKIARSYEDINTYTDIW